MDGVVGWFVGLLQATAGDPGDPQFFEWLYANVSVQGTLNIAGLSLLVILFSRDMILTKGQHERRVKDILANHDAVLLAKDERYADMMAEKTDRYGEMKESRNFYREGLATEQVKSQVLTEQLVESNKGLQVAARALGALEEAMPHDGAS